MTWDDIYARADGSSCGSPELKAKDNARHYVVCLVEDSFGFNIEDEGERGKWMRRLPCNHKKGNPKID